MDIKKADLAVLGGGPGGYVASIRASKMGLKTIVVERDHLGGVCLNSGCIPTKTLYHVAVILNEIKKAKDLGIDVSAPKLDFKETMARKNAVIEMQRNALQSNFKRNNIELIKGNGEIIADNKIAVKTDDHQEVGIEAKNIIIATGSYASNVKPFDLSEEGVMDNAGLLSIEEIPESLLIVGGGVIGSEFANIFYSFGTRVTIIEMLPRILPKEDGEVSKVINKVFEQRGIDIFTDTVIEKVEKSGKSFICTSSGGERITADSVLISVGRRPNSSGIGIEKIGLELDQKGYIKTDLNMRTNIGGIYAVGDVIGGLQLAHVAAEEGKVAAENIAGKDKKMDYSIVPLAVFTYPEIGTVGLNEAQARREGIEVCKGIFPFRSSGKAYITGETEGFIKIVTNSGTGEILGAQMIGPRASDLVHEIAVAMRGEMLVDDLVSTIHSHPTFSEAVLEAAEDCSGVATHK
jgi:dihydrolipoamide dehydrogenase